MPDANRAQTEYWHSAAGLQWITHEHALDMAMAPMLDLLLDAAGPMPEHRVLDIGCGTGASTIAVAALVPQGGVTGIDISEPLLSRAKERAAAVANAAFLLADAQTHPFAAGHDLLISRVGMSFFSDAVAAFRNLSLALRPCARMAFVSWASAADNPWFSIPRDAAIARLGPVPKADPTAPGPLAFQDAGRVARMMVEAGLQDIVADPVAITLTPPDGVRGAARAASSVGPAARVMKAHNGSAKDAKAIEDTVATAFAAFETDSEVRVPAVMNLFIGSRV